MTCLEWKEGETHREFLTKLYAIALTEWSCGHAQLVINTPFVTGFLDLRDTGLEEVTAALKTPRFFMLSLGNIPPMPRRSSTRRFQTLCATLASMPRIQTIHINAEDNDFNCRHAAIIQSMQQVQQLSIWGRFTDDESMHKLAIGLTGHENLQQLRLAIPVDHYPTILPTLYGIQTLRKIVLHKHVALESRVDADAARAMAGLLGMGATNPSLTIDFEHWDFGSPSQAIFCDALSMSSIHGIDLTGGGFVEPVVLAEALATSKLKDIRFSLLKFRNHGGVIAFLATLSRDIGRMAQLEAFESGSCDSLDAPGGNDDAVVQLVHAIAQCRNLKRLRLYFSKYPQHLDQALADCVVPENTHLREIFIRCLSLASADAPRITESPALLEALKRNYTIGKIDFRAVADFGRLREPTIDPWDPLLKKSIQIIPKLNSVGRRYMTRDAMNKMAGTRLLGQVSDDLDCVFYHLSRENPSLCDRAAGGSQGNEGSRKRRRSLEEVIHDHLRALSWRQYFD